MNNLTARSSHIVRTIAALTVTLLCAGLAGCGTPSATPSRTGTATGTACQGRDSQAQYDWPWYDSIEDLTASSDRIVYARITSCTQPPKQDTGYDTTITAEVLGAVNGNDEDSTDGLPQSGDVISMHGYTASGSDAGKLAVGGEYVFFLSYHDGTYAQLTPALSTFEVKDANRNTPTNIRNADGSFPLSAAIAVKLGVADEHKLTVSEPVSDDDVRRMAAVNRAVGFDDDMMHDDDADVVNSSKASWWSTATVDQDGNAVPPAATATMSLAPVPVGKYRLTMVCSGTGSFDAELTIDEAHTQHRTISCTPDGVASGVIDMTVADAGEKSWIRFTPTDSTKAAGGFRFDKVG
ncbi:hypothetical protein DSM100688_1595 [Bifidobacterium ramosum]|uniref:Lipoprotein n=1 Tax=Bifidobacterium ramosum TaxID=1798158 RepID=A0A6L4WZU1_9BIFI|nr:hypothetical protein [Bifidobacterium ramosum]KAB8287508.1 hypothetical protein DSM100688_1595 [Bifidobacterium ramosum]NEG72228.1 hypothetical protein [Bifidobacterium ramosum]